MFHYRNQLFMLAAALVTQLMGCDTKEKAQSVAVASIARPTLPPPWADRRSEGSGFPCDVEQVLAVSCRRCHWQPKENDAPFGLVKWENTQNIRSGKPIFMLMAQMVSADLMPPLDLALEPAVTPLSAEQKKILLSWLEAGAKRSTDICSK